MVKYTIMISGVHYGANGDLVAGQKDTPEMHKRTHELLEWLDRERPIVVMGPVHVTISIRTLLSPVRMARE